MQNKFKELLRLVDSIDGAISQREMAGSLGITVPTMNGRLLKAVAHGLISRDKCMRTYHVTKLGREILESCPNKQRPQGYKQIKEIIRSIDNKFVTHVELHNIINKIYRICQEEEEP